MPEPDLVQQQRAALRAFRQATAQRVKTEADATARFSANRSMADSVLNNARQSADAHLTKARSAVDEARASLSRADLQHALDQSHITQPAGSPNANAERELAQCSGRLDEIVTDISTSVDALLRWQARRRLLLRTAAATLIVLVAVLTATGYYGYQAWRTERYYQAAVAALDAGQWEQTCTALQQLATLDGNCKPARNHRGV